jgi:hypothetical protein
MGTTWRGKAYQQTAGRGRSHDSSGAAPVPMVRRRQGLTDEEWNARAAAWGKVHGMPAGLWLGPLLDPKPEMGRADQFHSDSGEN